MKKEPLVSVIIPAYNADKYIQRCVDSVRSQDYKKLQIIIVDDGSTDDTANVCKKMVDKDSRIELYSKKNSGVANTRNYGLDHAIGDYVMFVDADDYIASDMVALLLSKIKKSDFAMCNTIIFDGQNNIIKKGNIKTQKINSQRFWDYVYNGFWVECIVPWNKLYNRRLFNKLRYPANKTNEDEYLITRLISRCNSIQIINEALYFHYDNPQSLSNIGNGVGLKFLDSVDALLDRATYALKSKEYYLVDYSLKAIPTLLIKQYSLRNSRKYKKLKQQYFYIYKNVVQHHKISKQAKIRFILFRYFSFCYFLAFQLHLIWGK